MFFKNRLALMGVQWNNLSADIQQALESSLAAQYPHMITLGVSISIYGMGVMGARWEDMLPTYRAAACAAILRCFHRHAMRPATNSQSVSNVVYALGLSGVQWELLPSEVQATLLESIVQCAGVFKCQEIANVMYG